MPATRNELITENLGLVYDAAHKCRKRTHAELDDLIQAGCIGLIKASDRFDVTKGYKFSSFAMPYIRGTMMQFLRDKVGLVRLPRGLQELVSEHRKIRDDLAEKLGRFPTVAEVAAAIEVSPAKVREAETAYLNYRYPKSLDIPAESGEEETLLDLLPAENQGQLPDNNIEYLIEKLAGNNFEPSREKIVNLARCVTNFQRNYAHHQTAIVC